MSSNTNESPPSGWPPGYPFPPPQTNGWTWQGPQTPPPPGWPSGVFFALAIQFTWPPGDGDANQQSSSQNLNVGLIVGAVCTSLFALAAIAFALWWLRKHEFQRRILKRTRLAREQSNKRALRDRHGGGDVDTVTASIMAILHSPEVHTEGVEWKGFPQDFLTARNGAAGIPATPLASVLDGGNGSLNTEMMHSPAVDNPDRRNVMDALLAHHRNDK
ncbi:hypothetical protein HDU98_006760 [Podochytrium sp. JEL0797]|nr:hypothetical protein HDU98_006760 [Podochytrium sp. JEL0797]